MLRSIHLLLIAFAFAFAFSACGKPEAESPPFTQSTAKVLTAFYPTTFWAEFLLDGAVPVQCLLPADEDPSSWQPSRQQLQKFRQAALLVLNGAEFESWVSRSNLAASRVVKTAAAASGQLLETNSTAHTHGGGGMHSHGKTDGHTWMDPQLAKLQTQSLLQALLRTFPEQADSLHAKAAELDLKFADLDLAFKELSPLLSGRILYTNHAAYDYPARRYGWKLHNLDLNPAANAVSWPPFALPETGPCILLWEQQPDVDAALELEKAHQVLSVIFDPCEQPVEGLDYFQRMHANIDRLAAALQQLAAAE